MKVEFVKIGRVVQDPVKVMVAEYEKRLRAYVEVSSQVLKTDYEFVNGIYYVALDERGNQFTSQALSDKIQQWQLDPQIKKVCFVIGGPYGLSDTQKMRCSMLWSLSSGTLTSDLAWLVTWEQVYRAFTILKGSSYHHA